jgi:hypothetical protein
MDFLCRNSNTEEIAAALVAQATVSKHVGDFEQSLLSLEKAWPTLRPYGNQMTIDCSNSTE